jgi:hypothetical protein
VLALLAFQLEPVAAEVVEPACVLDGALVPAVAPLCIVAPDVPGRFAVELPPLLVAPEAALAPLALVLPALWARPTEVVANAAAAAAKIIIFFI